jgi:pimeloyl-ACP methyl ester carboxylesterase
MPAISTAPASQIHSEDQDEFTVHDRRVVVDGTNTQYLEGGNGSPLLLLHGHEQSATSWRWVIPALARTHRVLALSLPGTGESGPSIGNHAPGNDLTPFVAAFLDTLGVQPPLDVVGHSAGGAIALRLALIDPARIRTLTLVDSAGLGQAVHPLLALDTLPGIGELAIMISRIPGGAMARTSLSTAMLFAQPWRIPAEFIAEHHALGRRPGQLETSTAMARALFGPDGQRQILLEHLPTLTTPTLVIWGGCDYVLPARQAQAAVDLPAQRAAGSVPPLRAPAARRAARALHHRAQRVAHRAH